MRAEEELQIKNIKISSTKTVHTDPTCIGWRFEGTNHIVGYTSDTIYFKNIGKQFHGCDVLILNCLFNKNPYKDKDVEFSRHMDSEDAIEIISAAQPELAIIQHYGMEMLKSNPWQVAKRITQATGVKTMAVRDFQEISFDKHEQKFKTLNSWSQSQDSG